MLPAQGVEVTTEASYNGANTGPSTVTDSNPGTALSTSRAGPGGPGIGNQGVAPQATLATFDEAIATGRALLPGTVGSYSHAGGFNPGFGPGPNGVSATASATQITHWMASSDDPAQTTVDIDVAAFFDGTLLTSNFCCGASLYANVRAELNAYDATGASIYNFIATAEMNDATGFSSSANWSGDFVSSYDPNSANNQATVNYFEYFDDVFTVQVGEVFAWESTLSTEAFAEGAFELFAVADFLNTGDATPEVNTAGAMLVQVPVPLPASLPLIVVALGGLFRMRHKAIR